MKKQLFSKIPALLLALVVSLFCSSSAFATSTIVIENADAPGVGFNDTTPATPVGGNAGTTVGQQRLNAFQFAANIWGATVTSATVIKIRASWAGLQCTSTTAILGAAGSDNIWRNFTNAPVSNTWYTTAQANALAGRDLNGTSAEISAQFNLNIGTPGCLDSNRWYYGLDTGHSTNEINLVTVLLHEFGHGLGFASFADEETGVMPQGLPGIYDRFLLDNTTGKTWAQMTDAERVTSAINTNNLVWNGPQVMADAVFLTGGKDSAGHPKVYTPSPVKVGSSISHWAREASPNQLMEPNISNNLTLSVTTPLDLTYSLLKDIGWCASCPAPPPPSPPPANDNLASAQAISGCSGTVTGTNVSATRESGEPSHSPDGDAGGGSVWYQWQAPSTGSVTITTAGSTYDTLLAVYTGGTSVAGLTSIVKNDDVELGVITTSSVTFTATAGTVYKIAVDGYGGETGNITLNWVQANCSLAGPVLVTEEGTNRALALDSVTLVRGPFHIVGANNFSADRHTRVMLFTSNLGLTTGSDLSVLSVKVQGIQLPVESVGTLPGVAQDSYIIVRLADQLPTGDLNVNVTLRGATSNTAVIGILP